MVDPARALAEAFLAEGVGTPVHRLARVGSTNEVAREAASAGAAHGSAFLAERQEAGRGRLGRSWLDGTGNLMMSVVVRTRLPSARLPLLVLGAGIAAAEACGPPVRLKWPNDLVTFSGEKVGGILAEADGTPEDRVVVIGFGINLAEAPPGLPAVSLADLQGAPPNRDRLAARIVGGLLSLCDRAADDPATILDRWRQLDATSGRRVRIGEVQGLACGIGPDGSLEVRDDGGRVHRVLAGDVQMVREPA